MHFRVLLSIGAALLLMLVLGCGGGTSAPMTGRAVLSFEWPQGTRQMSAATQSVVITAENATGFHATQCANRPITGTTTQVAFAAVPIGDVTFTAQAFPEHDGVGIPQATGSLVLTITAGNEARVPMTMHSTIATISLDPADQWLVVNDFVILSVTARDAKKQVVLVSPDELSWSISGDAVTFDQATRRATAKQLGRATVTVTEMNSHCSAVSEITVSEKPDGKIYFISTRDGNFEIYSIYPDGTGETRLTNNTWKEDEVNVSPDGTKVIYSSYETGVSHIYRMNPDGTGKEQLTDFYNCDYGPAYTPDGTQIYFMRSMENGDELYVMNADGTNQTRLTTNIWGDVLPKITPDGQTIVFDRYFGEYYNLYKMNIDGTGEVALTTSTMNGWLHCISKDGSHVIFTYGSSIARINLDGTGMTLLTPPSHESRDWLPCYSPDNKHIVFSSNRIDGANYELYIMDADGKNARRLTHCASTDYFPVWSP